MFKASYIRYVKSNAARRLTWSNYATQSVAMQTATVMSADSGIVGRWARYSTPCIGVRCGSSDIRRGRGQRGGSVIEQYCDEGPVNEAH